MTTEAAVRQYLRDIHQSEIADVTLYSMLRDWPKAELIKTVHCETGEKSWLDLNKGATKKEIAECIHNSQDSFVLPPTSLLRKSMKDLENIDHESLSFLRDMIEAESFQKASASLPLILGAGKEVNTTSNDPVIYDLMIADLMILDVNEPALLSSIITSLIYRETPSDLKITLVDTNSSELKLFENSPYLVSPLAKNHTDVSQVFEWLKEEMDRREDLFRQSRSSGFESYNARTTSIDDSEVLPEKLTYLVVVINEFDFKDDSNQRDLNKVLLELIEQAPGAGVYFILSTQLAHIDLNLKMAFDLRIISNGINGASFEESDGELGRREAVAITQFPIVSEADINRVNLFTSVQRETSFDCEFHHRLEENPKLNFWPKKTFDNFVVAANNRLAYSALEELTHPSNLNAPAIFIFSKSGLGKSHLLQSYYQECFSQNPYGRIELVQAEEFSNLYIEAMQHNQLLAFRKRFRQADVLLIDDIHFLKGKSKTQEELLHTLNALTKTGKQLVLTSHYPSTELYGIRQDLISRFEQALVVELGEPDLEARVGILKSISKDTALELSDDLFALIATNITGDIRKLQGFMKRLALVVETQAPGVTRALVENLLKKILRKL